ncbi:MAG TPA: DUF6544 family protein [Streptosporangiaceae bacterium]|jgi:hypothetical protein
MNTDTAMARPDLESWAAPRADRSSGVFSRHLIEDQPEPVQRYFRHALAPGTPLARSVRLRMHGRIRVNGWLPFRAEQVIVDGRGFLWRARAAGGLVSGYDLYDRGGAEQRFSLLGIVPVARATGPDVVRSAMGRAVAELSLLPTALLPSRGVSWAAADPDHVVATVRADGHIVPLTLAIDEEGAVRELSLPRWGNPGGGAYAEIPFGLCFETDRTFDGVTIPCIGRAGWWFGTDRWAEGEFFHMIIDAATFI